MVAAENGYEATVRILIRLLHDGEGGFNDVGGKMKDPKHRSFYLEEASVRTAFASELERSLSETIGADVHEGGTLLGPVHRAYLDMKAALGANDCGLLSSTELCERLTIRTYGAALEADGLTDALHTVVGRQAEHVRRVYRMLAMYREAAQGWGQPRRDPPRLDHPTSENESPGGRRSKQNTLKSGNSV